MILRKSHDRLFLHLSRRSAKAFLLFFCAVFMAACGDTEVMTARNEEQAIATVNTLKQHGIEANKGINNESNPPKFVVLVSNPLFSNDNTYGAQSLITDYCLAQEDPSEIVSSGVVSSSEIEMEKVKRQTRVMIIEQLRRMPSVVCPEVGVTLPRSDTIINPTPSSVSITVSTIGESTITNDDLFNIAKGSVPDLKLENFSGRIHPKQVRPVKPASSATATIAIVSTAVVLILGSLAAVFLLQKRRSAKASQQNTAEDEGAEDFLTDGENGENEALALRENE